MATYKEKLEEAVTLFNKAIAIASKPDATQEERNSVEAIMTDAKRLKAEGLQLKEALAQVEELKSGMSGGAASGSSQDGSSAPKFKSLGENLFWIHKAGDVRYKDKLHPALTRLNDPSDKGVSKEHSQGNLWEKDFKDLSEGTGAAGGYLVQAEFRSEMLQIPAPVDDIRALATVIPMTRRQLVMPRLKQTATTAGSPHFFGGIEAQWTEEAAQKDITNPVFGQLVLTAYKLVCYTRSSDELLADSAGALVAFLTGPMGFSGAIKWEEEYAFLRGSGAGQPQGIIDAPATLTQARVASVGLNIADIVGMIAKLYGDGVWHISRSQLANLMQLNGPAGNPSYIFMPNAREGLPAMLMGYPIKWSDKLPVAGTRGDVTLANWRMYLIGDRQATTIDSTNVELFRNDQTSWRAVHRVDGQPWLEAPITFQDGSTQVSPFVVLSDKST